MPSLRYFLSMYRRMGILKHPSSVKRTKLSPINTNAIIYKYSRYIIYVATEKWKRMSGKCFSSRGKEILRETGWIVQLNSNRAAAYFKMEKRCLVWSLKSSILSLTSSQMDQTFELVSEVISQLPDNIFENASEVFTAKYVLILPCA